MDNYLDTLIRKEEQPVEESVIDEIKEAVTADSEVIVPNDAEQLEEIQDNSKEVDAPEDKDSEDEAAVKEDSEVVKSDKDVEPKPNQTQSEDAVSTKEDTKSVTDSSALSIEKGQTIPVKDIKIFNTPDKNSVFKIFTGNITYLGEVSGMYQINYMKYGFGLVTGYTTDLFN